MEEYKKSEKLFFKNFFSNDELILKGIPLPNPEHKWIEG
jgi:hypothetical protein